MSHIKKYVDVILPLALDLQLTYGLPETLESEVQAGSRVVVQMGKRKFYTAIVRRVTTTPPPEGTEEKDITDVVDARPLLLPVQLQMWDWIATYYMCTPGEVMKAALPSGLKLESETLVARNADFDNEESLPIHEAYVLNLLPTEKAIPLADLQKAAGRMSILPAVRRLVENGAANVEEHITRQFKPRTETRVRLADTYNSEAALNALFEKLHRTPKQAELLTLYLDLSDTATALTLENAQLRKEVSKKALLEKFSGGAAVLTSLRDKGILETYAAEIGRIKTVQALPEHIAKPLSDDQQRALNEIHTAFQTHDTCLLHGVTSSGKTQVYTQLIRETIAQGRQVLYLLPEIALTTQIMQRLGRVFGEQMGVYHSRFPDKERVELWQRQLDKPFPLILGVRSSLFLPFRNLGLIIVDEEHETSYKQQDPSPRYNARDVALVLAQKYGAKVLLGTATPAFETYRNARIGKYALVEMSQRFGGIQMPQIVVEDVKELKRKKLMKTPFSPRLTSEIRAALSNGEQVILFQNRRGYSPVLQCRTCGWTPHCTRCDVPLTFHQKINRIICHYCGTIYDMPKQCPNCADTELRDMGYGTEKIEAAVKAVFPEARTARMDLDTTRARSAYDDIISDFSHGRTNILIGTQMVTKGLDFENVRVVGILNADQMLSQPDFRAFERGYQMMSQVAGRAGRRGKQGLVVLQTRQPELPVVDYIVRSDYKALYMQQMQERLTFHYPPFTRLVAIYLKHRDEHVVEGAAYQLAAYLRPHFGDCLLGPDKPAVGRVQLLYIRKILVKVSPKLDLASVRRTLLDARRLTQSAVVYKSVNIYFDVNPL